MAIIRTSDRGSFKACRRKWDLGSKLRQNYEPVAPAKPLEFGTAIHAGFEEYYDPLWWTKTTWQERSASAIGAFKAQCERQKLRRLTVSGDESLSLEEEEDFAERLLLGVEMFKNYGQYYADKDMFTPLYTELEFEVPIEGTDHVYQGRIDLVIEDAYGEYWIVDHKTRGSFGGTDHYTLDEQATSYAWALEHMLKIPIAGVMFNEVLKAYPKKPEPLARGGFSQSKQQRTTYELYYQTLVENNEPAHKYAEFLEFLKAKGNPFFRRIQIHKSPLELANQGEQIRLEALDMANPDIPIYPSPGMFNCMGCAFSAPCMAINDGADIEWIMETSYRKRDY